MKRKTKRKTKRNTSRNAKNIVAVFLLSLSFLLMPSPLAKACAPDLAYAILVNGNHPDLPLKLFAAGNIGIVQPCWAKSYLVVAYRVLSGKPLSKQEQESVLKLWHKRIVGGSPFGTSILAVDEKDEFLKLRAKALGADSKKNPEVYWKMDSFAYENGIGDTAFQLARNTLTSLLKKYPVKSPQAREWIKAQDGIFAIGTEKVIIPNPLPKTADPVLQNYRNYQIAAANFYLKRFDKAETMFQSVAAKSDPALSKIAAYMVLRSKSNQILRGDGTGDEKAVSDALQKAADSATKATEREDILDLLRPISYLNLSSADVVKKLATMVDAGTSKRFGNDVGDLTFLLDGNPPLYGLNVQGSKENVSDAHDLADFVCSMQKQSYLLWPDSDDDKKKAREADLKTAKHAREMWSKTKGTVWLVAALSGMGLRLSDDRELFDAAMKTPETSPAFLTARFYVIDSLISAGKRDEARQLLRPILAATNLPPSTRNLFSTQMAAASQSLSDYLKYAVLNPPEILSSSNDLVSQKFKQLESAQTFQTETPALDTPMALDLSRNAPLSTWMRFAQSQSTSPRFKPVIVRAAWTRAQMLQKPNEAAKLESALATTNPSLAAAVAKIKNSAEGPARQFAIACLILRNYGMSPYLSGGAERHDAAIGAFDWYNNNFWVPYPVEEKQPDDENSYSYNDMTGYVGDNEVRDKMKSYWQPGVSRYLSDAEKKSAKADLLLLNKNHPSRFLGQIVLDYARSHPKDPDVPEMLYRVVKLPKWTEVTPVGSEFSKKAYVALHKAYPGSPWAKKAVCYY